MTCSKCENLDAEDNYIECCGSFSGLLDDYETFGVDMNAAIVLVGRKATLQLSPAVSIAVAKAVASCESAADHAMDYMDGVAAKINTEAVAAAVRRGGELDMTNQNRIRAFWVMVSDCGGFVESGLPLGDWFDAEGLGVTCPLDC